MYAHTGTRHQTLGRSFTRAQRRRTSVLAAVAFVTLLVASSVTSDAAIVPTVPMGTAGQYSVLAGSEITNTDTPTLLKGSLGLSEGTDVTGFEFSTTPGPGVVEGAVNIANPAAVTAKSDLTIAYLNAAGRPLNEEVAADLVGLTLVGGVYAVSSKGAMGLTGTLTLNGEGNPNSVFIFQTDSTLITGSSANVVLINEAQPCNVFWQVGSSATIGSGSSFVGTVLAAESITVAHGATVEGRVLAQVSAVTFDNNTISQPRCDLSTGNGDNGNGDNGNGDNGNGNGGNGSTTTTAAGNGATTTTAAGDDTAVIPHTGAGLVLAVLIGGLGLLVVGGRTMVVAKRRRADLR